MSGKRFRSWLILFFKCCISAALLYVVYRLADEEGFEDLVHQPKRWPPLVLAAFTVFSAVALGIVRWYLLVLALGLPFSLRDAFRLGFLAYLLNFVSLGSVGGDLFKAIFIAREQPLRKTEAVATVVVDRAIGLYALLLVASAAIFFSGRDPSSPPSQVDVIRNATVLLTGVGGMALLALLVPGFTGGTMTRFVSRLPVVGVAAVKVVDAIRIYRERRRVVFVALLMSCGVHVLLTLAIYLIASGLPGPLLALRHHFLIVPLSMVASALPLPLAGLGAFEGVLSFLYKHFSDGIALAHSKGLIVALCFRVVTILVAMVGGVYYFANRSDVSAAMHEAEKVA